VHLFWLLIFHHEQAIICEHFKLTRLLMCTIPIRRYVKVFLRIFTLRIFNHLITVVFCLDNTVNKLYESKIWPFCLIYFRNVSLYFHPRRRCELSSILGVETYRIPIIPVYTVRLYILQYCMVIQMLRWT